MSPGTEGFAFRGREVLPFYLKSQLCRKKRDTRINRSAGKKTALCSVAADGLLRCYSEGEGDGTPLQCSGLENPRGGGAWCAAVHGAAKSPTGLSDFTFTLHLHALEKETAPHSSVLAWRTSGTGEPGALPSVGSHRVGHD